MAERLNKKVLIVEDEAPLRNAVSDILSFEGFDVFQAKNGQEGLETALKEHPDMILLDLMMPIMDGCTMYKRLKEDAATKDIPVIIITARSGMSPMFDSGKGSSVQGYLVKPFGKNELLQMMDDILKKRSP